MPDYNKPNVPIHGEAKPQEMPNRPKSGVSGSIPAKESIGKRILKSFVKAKPSELAEGLLFNTIIPGALKVISDTGKSAIDGMLYGTAPKAYPNGTSSTNYNAVSATAKVNRMYTGTGSVASKIWPNNIEYDSVEDATHIRDLLVDHISNYQQVSISAVYDFSQLQQYDQPTYQNYGWTNLSNARIIPSTKTAGRFMIDFPPPKLITR